MSCERAHDILIKVDSRIKLIVPPTWINAFFALTQAKMQQWIAKENDAVEVEEADLTLQAEQGLLMEERNINLWTIMKKESKSRMSIGWVLDRCISMFVNTWIQIISLCLIS